MTPETVTIIDPSSGSTAKILVGFGFNCYEFNVRMEQESVQAFWADPNFSSGQERASSSGTPILFPYAGRLLGTDFQYEGQSYPQKEGDGIGNAIHGFVHCRPWRLLEQSESSLLGEFHASVDDSSLLERWPADFRIQCRYTLADRTLTAEFEISNPDDKPLPYSFGTHTYFRLPLGETGDAGSCVVKVPANKVWEFAQMQPTGRISSTDGFVTLKEGMAFKDIELDNLFSDIDSQAGRIETSIHDPNSGYTMRQSFEDTYPFVVVYVPPHREAICMEPYTSVPDAYRLKQQGIDGNACELAPGESFRTCIKISVT